MNQIHIINSNKKFDEDKLRLSTQSIIRVVVKHGVFDDKYTPPGPWTIDNLDVGVYRIIHNLGTIEYGVCVSSLNNENLSIETLNLTKTSFDVHIKQNNAPQNKSFAFSLNFHIGD